MPLGRIDRVHWTSCTTEEWSCRVCPGWVSVFLFSLRITCFGITSSKKLPPYHIVAETLSTWKITCNRYERNMGTVSAMVATVNNAWSRIYMKRRFCSPSKPLNLHHMLLAFCAFFDSSLVHKQFSNNHTNRQFNQRKNQCQQPKEMVYSLSPLLLVLGSVLNVPKH